MGATGQRPDSFPSRVCDPGRFLVLHEAADVVLDELTERYIVDRRESKEPAGPTPDAEVVRTIRLMPRCPAAGPLAIAFTDSPGIVLRLGRWFLVPLPDCGRDGGGLDGGDRGGGLDGGSRGGGLDGGSRGGGLDDCGHDDCAEDPAVLVASLRAQATAHVEGGLWERVRRGVTGSWLDTRLIGPGLRTVRQRPIDPAEARAARREGFAAAVQWAPWSRRGP